MSRRRTLDELEQMAWNSGGHVEVDLEEGIAVLVVNGKETGDYASISAFGEAS
jgi:hypothetical protein